jgi:uncharacterized protein YaeQ
MALKSTIYKASVNIADIDHGYYAEHNLTLARHPSETDERMMIRLAAFAHQAFQIQALCNGDATMAFGAGLSDPDEPDVWLRDFAGDTALWIEVGQPEERPILKACGKARRVAVYPFASSTEIWWQGIATKLTRANKLSVIQIASDSAKSLEAMAQRTMSLQATIQDGALSITDGERVVDVEMKTLMGGFG